jgi:glycosyltransferase involved in cell wall biosynthesis
MRPDRVEVILSAYGAERELRLVLEAYLGQSESGFSLAVADDGSGPSVERLAHEFADRGMSIRHLWHEDRGFRKARILNRAIGTSEADYLILSDGDCIPCRRFVRDHLEWAEAGRFVCGRRVLLGEELTRAILDRDSTPAWLENPFRLLLGEARGQLRRAWVGVRQPRLVSRLLSRKQRGLWGCNTAEWMKDLVRINGFNNAFEGWGYEDIDIERRLLASGLRPKAIRGRGAVFHLYHPGNSSRINEQLYASETVRSRIEAASGMRETMAERD